MLQWKNYNFFSFLSSSQISLNSKSWHYVYYTKVPCISNESIKPRTVGFFLCHSSWKLFRIYVSIYDGCCLTINHRRNLNGGSSFWHVIVKRWRLTMTPPIGGLLQTPYLNFNKKSHKIWLHLCPIICVLLVENNCWIN